jgi:glycosyltransferase involved in cell wall biosynthesis
MKRRISCLMVTLGTAERLELIKRSIHGYLTQTYPDRELVLVPDLPPESDLDALRSYLDSLSRPDIRCVVPPRKMSLGALRNLSVESAQGSLVCQWDDDDIFHSRRLEAQAQALQANDAAAVYMGEILHFFSPTREMFWTDWSRTILRCHPATLLAEKDKMATYPESGDESARGEDTFVLKKIRSVHPTHYLSGPASLYVYVFHSGNTMAYKHHRFIATTLAVSLARCRAEFAALAKDLASLDLGSQPITVCASEQIAGIWSPQTQTMDLL